MTQPQTTTEPTNPTPAAAPEFRATRISDEELSLLVAEAAREAGIDPASLTPAQRAIIEAAVVAGAHFEAASDVLDRRPALSAAIQDRGVMVLAEVFRAAAQAPAVEALWPVLLPSTSASAGTMR